MEETATETRRPPVPPFIQISPAKHTGLVKNYYDEAKTILKDEYFLVDGKKEGLYKNYHYNSDQVAYVCNYVSGLKEGQSLSYHTNGMVWYVYNFVNSKIEGEFKCFYKNGNLEYMCYYTDNNINGELKRYRENGEYYRTDLYVDGRIVDE